MTPTRPTLFPDQADLVTRVRKATLRHKSILLCLPTGGGKSVCAADMIAGAYEKRTSCWFMVPRRELLRQVSATLEAFNIPHGIIGAGYAPNPFAIVNAVMAQTAARRLDKLTPPKILFVDECHVFGGDVERIIAWVRAAGGWVIGMSATPWRSDGRGMGDIYEVMEQGPSVADLIENKRLASFRYFAPAPLDLSGIKTSKGDYAPGQLAEFMESQTAIVGDTIKTWRETAQGRITVGFATSRKHAGIMTEAFKAAGIGSAMIDGTMDEAERKRVIRALARRDIDVLWSVSLLAFGFDLATAAGMDVRIKAIIDASPTKSLAWQCQKNGRALRYDEEPAIFLDHAGNVTRHQLPDAPRNWTLEGSNKRASDDKEPTQPVRQCEIAKGGCGFVHRPAPRCPNCGFVYPIEHRMVEEVDGELREITGAGPTPLQEQGIIASRDGLDGLIRLGHARGYKSPEMWAAKIMSARLAKGTRR